MTSAVESNPSLIPRPHTQPGNEGKNSPYHSCSVQAAKAGTAATSKMEAKAGRACNVHSSQLTKPDPGAHAVALWMEAVYEGVRE